MTAAADYLTAVAGQGVAGVTTFERWQVERFTEAMRSNLAAAGRRVKQLYDARQLGF
jgi:hypothetical protein